MGSDSTIRLAGDAEHGLADWERAAAAVLRAADRLSADAPDSEAWRVLAPRDPGRIVIRPLGTPELTRDLPDPGLPGQPPFTRGATAMRTDVQGWDVRGWFTDPDADAASLTAELENGAGSLWLTVGSGGLDPDRLASLLAPVYLDVAPVVLEAPDEPRAAADAFLTALEDQGVEAHHAANLGADPLGAALRGRGDTDLRLSVDLARIAEARGVRGVIVDATAAHDLGGSEVEELAYSLYAGAVYLRELTEAGLSANAAAGQLEFRYAATDEQFMTIAKLRAARRLWNRIGELSGIVAPARAQRQHAVTSRPMMCRYDSYTNMVRATVATFAAGVGGADAVTTLPFDEPLGLPTPFSRRIARNTSALLIRESHVAATGDPVGGAHAVEKLTDDLARAAWSLFGELESAGGRAPAFALLGERVDAAAADRADRIARRVRPITGVSEYPNLTETPPVRTAYPQPPNVLRYAAEYEAMRDAPSGRPAFLATMGSVAEHTARAAFAANLLAAGGVAHQEAGAVDGVAEAVDAYRRAGASPVACLVGSDAAYRRAGAELASALRTAGAALVVAVAPPRDAVEALAVDDVIAPGADVLAFLRRAREALSA